MININIETFVWDGLSLIDRNGTSYINEPHAGGGNPVLAINGGNDTQVIFNDMLGTSVGTVSVGEYSAIEKTTFGYKETNENTTAETNFYTGKPNVRNLGYVFLMRNYRSDLSKWQTEDPIGYPDGWNNFAYCNNQSTMGVDLYGAAKKHINSRKLDTDVPYAEQMHHSWTEIELTKSEYENLSSDYKDGEFKDKWDYSEETDSYSVTLSAYQGEDGNLEKRTGYEGDTNEEFFETYENQDINTINEILETHRNYDNKADYDTIPYWGERNNCHSYTNTINKGVVPDAMKDNALFPGMDYTIKNKYFE